MHANGMSQFLEEQQYFAHTIDVGLFLAACTVIAQAACATAHSSNMLREVTHDGLQRQPHDAFCAARNLGK